MKKINLEEAKKKIEQYEKRIAEIKERDDYNKFLVDVDWNSITSVLLAYTEVRKIKTKEAKNKSKELRDTIIQLVLSQKFYNDQIFFAEGFDEKTVQHITDEKAKIVAAFQEIQDEWDPKEYENAINKLNSIESKVYSIKKNIDVLGATKMKILGAYDGKKAQARVIERKLKELQEQLSDVRKQYGEVDQEPKNNFFGVFASKSHNEKLGNLQHEINRLQDDYNKKKKEYEGCVDPEAVLYSLKRRYANHILPEPVFNFLNPEKVVNTGLPKIIYNEDGRFFVIKIDKDNEGRMMDVKKSALSEKHATIMSCDDKNLHAVTYDNINDLTGEIYKIYGVKKSEETLFLLFEGMGKEEYEQKKEQIRLERQKQEEERKKQQSEQMKKEQDKIIDIFVSNQCCIVLKKNGTLQMLDEHTDYYSYWTYKKKLVESWDGIKTVYLSDAYVIGLRHDGTVKVATDLTNNRSDDDYDIRCWKKIKQLSIEGKNIIGVTSNGTEKVERGYSRERIITGTGIYKIYRGCNHDYAIDSKGKVSKTDSYLLDYPVEKWKNIIDIVEISSAVIGLTKDGRLEVEIDKEKRLPSFVDEVHAQRGVIKIIDNEQLAMALKSDGTVYCTSYHGWRGAIKKWTNVVDIAIDAVHCVGLRSDGTVVIASDPEYTGNAHEKWRNVEKIATARMHTVALTKDGQILFADNGYKAKD